MSVGVFQGVDQTTACFDQYFWPMKYLSVRFISLQIGQCEQVVI